MEAIEAQTREHLEIPSAIGSRPSVVVMLVSRIGRKRVSSPRRIASARLYPAR
ncbi:MAG: hypothetical protein N838_23280 [Thiohalocapsa sp. PB-PSB1]|jgi:hypothetical protein|nr:MAG: hypothetical protein N838_23280 [Thiohalocapsa sp. PB-PSB1]